MRTGADRSTTRSPPIAQCAPMEKDLRTSPGPSVKIRPGQVRPLAHGHAEPPQDLRARAVARVLGQEPRQEMRREFSWIAEARDHERRAFLLCVLSGRGAFLGAPAPPSSIRRAYRALLHGFVRLSHGRYVRDRNPRCARPRAGEGVVRGVCVAWRERARPRAVAPEWGARAECFHPPSANHGRREPERASRAPSPSRRGLRARRRQKRRKLCLTGRRRRY